MRFWTRFIGWQRVVVMALLAAILAYLLIIGDSAWYVSVLGSVLVIAVITGSSVYFVYRRRALSTLSRMNEQSN